MSASFQSSSVVAQMFSSTSRLSSLIEGEVSYPGYAPAPSGGGPVEEAKKTVSPPFGWVTADEAYGDNGPLRAFLEEREIALVLALRLQAYTQRPMQVQSYD